MKVHAHTSPTTREPCPGKFQLKCCYLGFINIRGRITPILMIAGQCPDCRRVSEEIHAGDREKLYQAYGPTLDLPFLALELGLGGTDGACGP